MPLKDSSVTDRLAATSESKEESDAIRDAAQQHARLHILRLLAKSGATGMTVGELAKQSTVALSTVINHLQRLADVGAIRREEKGNATRQWLTETAKTVLADLLSMPATQHPGPRRAR